MTLRISAVCEAYAPYAPSIRVQPNWKHTSWPRRETIVAKQRQAATHDNRPRAWCRKVPPGLDGSLKSVAPMLVVGGRRLRDCNAIASAMTAWVDRSDHPTPTKLRTFVHHSGHALPLPPRGGRRCVRGLARRSQHGPHIQDAGLSHWTHQMGVPEIECEIITPTPDRFASMHDAVRGRL